MDLFDCIRKEDIAESSKKNYIYRLKDLERQLDKPLMDIIADAKTTVEWLKQNVPRDTTRKNFITPILLLFRICPELLTKYPKQYGMFRGKHDEAYGKIEAVIEKGLMSDRQKEGYVPYIEFRKMIYKTPPRSLERLVMSVFGLIPPLRADMGQVRIYEDTLPESPEPNYILLKTKKGRKMPIGTLHLGEYKTAKSMGPIEQDLPADLIKEIVESLETSPRDWLFTIRGNKSQTPMSDAVFSKTVNGVFKDLFGKPLTIQILRHSFLSGLDWNQMTLENRKELGKSMGHNEVQGDRYRWINVEEQLK